MIGVTASIECLTSGPSKRVLWLSGFKAKSDDVRLRLSARLEEINAPAFHINHVTRASKLVGNNSEICYAVVADVKGVERLRGLTLDFAVIDRTVPRAIPGLLDTLAVCVHTRRGHLVVL